MRDFHRDFRRDFRRDIHLDFPCFSFNAQSLYYKSATGSQTMLFSFKKNFIVTFDADFLLFDDIFVSCYRETFCYQRQILRYFENFSVIH